MSLAPSPIKSTGANREKDIANLQIEAFAMSLAPSPRHREDSSSSKNIANPPNQESAMFMTLHLEIKMSKNSQIGHSKLPKNEICYVRADRKPEK